MAWVVLLLYFLHLLSPSSGYNQNDDASALLLFKASLSRDPSNSLSTWVNSTHPCSSSWLGVTCDPATRRVTRLVLEDLGLTGPVDPLSQLAEFRLLSLKGNSLYSSVPVVDFSRCLNLKHVYLSHNNLSGPFPAGVTSLRRLLRLDLSHNRFSGGIPMDELAELPDLLTLRLESNSFTGGIGSVKSASVMDLNVSMNSLSGAIPAWMSNFSASSFSGNGGLCGGPLSSPCSVPLPAFPAGGRKDGRTASNWVVAVIAGTGGVVVLAALVGVTCFCLYKRRMSRRDTVVRVKGGPGSGPIKPAEVMRRGGLNREEAEMVMFEGCKGFRNVDELLASSAELLGKGCVGATYKVALDEGKGCAAAVVVKRVRERRRGREVDAWLSVIGGLRHPNFVSLRAYYNTRDELLLVYDYLPSGSLHSLLHGNRGPGRTPLDWSTRLKLASESAQGLAFLHSYKKAKFFHGNLTSSNIIVSSSGSACISDIGLHQLLLTPRFSSDAYLAPELISSGNGGGYSINTRKFTQKCDVYSFGVVLLEILVGRLPGGEGETSLVKWVQRVGREDWGWEVFDFELLRYKEMEAEMVALMEVALLCLAPLPRDRPKMSMVHRMIEDIRMKVGSGGVGGPSPAMNNLSSDSSPASSDRNINFNAGGV